MLQTQKGPKHVYFSNTFIAELRVATGRNYLNETFKNLSLQTNNEYVDSLISASGNKTKNCEEDFFISSITI